MMNAVMTAEKRPADNHLVLKMTGFRKGAYEHFDGVYILLRLDLVINFSLGVVP